MTFEFLVSFDNIFELKKKKNLRSSKLLTETIRSIEEKESDEI